MKSLRAPQHSVQTPEPPRERGSIEILLVIATTLARLEPPRERGSIEIGSLRGSYRVCEEPPRERGSIEIVEETVEAVEEGAPS